MWSPLWPGSWARLRALKALGGGGGGLYALSWHMSLILPHSETTALEEISKFRGGAPVALPPDPPLALAQIYTERQKETLRFQSGVPVKSTTSKAIISKVITPWKFFFLYMLHCPYFSKGLESSDNSDIFCNKAKCVWHFYWYQWNIMMSYHNISLRRMSVYA